MIDTDEISILNKQLINTIGEIILQRLKEQKPIEKIKEDKNKNKNKIVDKKKCIKNIYSINREKKSINRFFNNLICLGLISQQPPIKVVPFSRVLNTKFLYLSPIYSLFLVPSNSIGSS